MMTERVRAPMDDSFECYLLAFCTVKTSADYELKLSRKTKTHTASALIVDIIEESRAGKPCLFLVESLTKIDDDEAFKAPEHMSRRIQFAAQATAVQGKTKTGTGQKKQIPSSQVNVANLEEHRQISHWRNTSSEGVLLLLRTGLLRLIHVLWRC